MGRPGSPGSPVGRVIAPDLVKRARSWEREIVPSWETRVVQRLLDNMTFPQEGSALVAECRTGYTARALAARLPAGVRCIAVDPVPEMLDMARNQYLDEHRHIWWDTRGVERLPYQANVFGLTLLASGLLTKEDMVAVGPALVRVTRVGGQVGLVVPLAQTFAGFYELFREGLQALGFSWCIPRLDAFLDSMFHEESLRVDLAAIGVRDLTVTIESWDLSFDGGESFLMSPPVRLLYMPYWLQIIEDEGVREQVLAYVHNAMDTYYRGVEMTMSVHVASVSGVVQ